MSAAAKPDYGTYPTLSYESARNAAHQLLALEGKGAPVSPLQLARIERFYRMEARLLDEERYAEWYALLTNDVFYWMPLIENRFRRDKRPLIDPGAMAFFDDRKADLAARIGRLSSGKVWTEDPPTRHVYIISGVEAFDTAVRGEIEVHSTFIQYRNRSERDESTIIGRRRDVLRVHCDTVLIARRLILLPQSILLTKNLSAFF